MVIHERFRPPFHIGASQNILSEPLCYYFDDISNEGSHDKGRVKVVNLTQTGNWRDPQLCQQGL